MRPGLLLDTHIALWWFTADPRLPPEECDLIRTRLCHVSLVSLWEVAIKYRLDKLPVSPQDFLGAIEAAGMRLMPIKAPHILATAGLPRLYGDPFDRLLVAQSVTELLTFLTADSKLADYGGPIHII